MPTAWQHRIIAIAPESNHDALNALWTIIAPEGETEADTWGIELSPTGLEPATHIGISTAATELMRILVSDTLADVLGPLVVDVADYRVNRWDTVLAEQELQVVHKEVELE